MAITLESNYCKKIGLRSYSSHQFSLTVRTEVTDLNQVPQESQRLYQLLQSSVDAAIKETGYLPESITPEPNGHANGNGKPASHKPVNGSKTDAWSCSPKQKELILKLVGEQNMPKERVEALAQQRFGKGVRQLNKLEASGLIEELMEQTQPTNRVTQ